MYLAMITILFPRGREVPGFSIFRYFHYIRRVSYFLKKSDTCLITKNRPGLIPPVLLINSAADRYFGFLYQCMFDGAEWVARWQMLHSVTTSSMCSSS